MSQPSAAVSQMYYRALRRALAQISGGESDASGRDAARTQDDNAPVAIDAEDGDELTQLGRALAILAEPLSVSLVALIQLTSSAPLPGRIPGSIATLRDDFLVELNVLSTSHPDLPGLLRGPKGRYSQLLSCIRRGEPSILRDVSEQTLLCDCLALSVSGVIEVVPLPADLTRLGENSDWALLVCAASEVAQTAPEHDERSDFLASAAQLLSVAVRGRRLDDVLRDRTRRVRLQALSPLPRPTLPETVIDRYRDLFQSSADGVIVLDDRGAVLWLNRAAEQLTGYASAGLVGRLLIELVAEPQRFLFAYALGLVLAECSVSAYDLALITTSQEYLLASMSTSAVLSPQRFIVLSFRDVTEKRILENELRKTKEFLERLIDSTVDGIIAADIKGNVVLFNRGAARITGYSPEEVIGKLPVWLLYPDGDAKRVMSELRSGEFGGRGRLLQSRQTVLGKDGQPVPVALSASIIYEGEEEVATVGVMSDLRERLHIEQKLLRTEERLAWSEKQAVLIELAGALAHELNQPLTSVMGYVQLLRRLLPGENSDLHEYAAVLEKEADRMAEIVRKIGHITRYETKSYVGQSRILDLDRSVWPSDPHSSDELDLHHRSQPDVGPLFERLRR